tara:strand:+ start:157 stop:564 length:408 start_codon:yes stop_codon:yes gene_type:complete
MVDTRQLYMGITDNPELSAFEMAVPSCSFDSHKNNNIRDILPGLREDIGKRPSEFNDTIFRSTLNQVLPCKGEEGAIKFNRPSHDLNAYMRPSQGYARHQKLGLATDHNKPMNKRIMPLAGFYNYDMINVLGGLK